MWVEVGACDCTKTNRVALLGEFKTGYEPGADMQADVLIADKAFNADERVIEPLAAAGKTAVNPVEGQPQVATDV